jgi:hypothetical protein
MASFEVIIRDYSSLFISQVFSKFINFNNFQKDYEVFHNFFTLRLTSKFFYNFFNNKINEITKTFYRNYMNDPMSRNYWFPISYPNGSGSFELLTENYIQSKSYGNFLEFVKDYKQVTTSIPTPSIWYPDVDYDKEFESCFEKAYKSYLDLDNCPPSPGVEMDKANKALESIAKKIKK